MQSNWEVRWSVNTKPVTYTCNLDQKTNYVNKKTAKLKCSNNAVISDQFKILREHRECYKTRYTLATHPEKTQWCSLCFLEKHYRFGEYWQANLWRKGLCWRTSKRPRQFPKRKIAGKDWLPARENCIWT